ncbi:hypothetical protein [Nocardiopsis sp. L17-MgMaSL7]|uniref:hypothetical protein n=1 Tax=Nocardiopsis sp. L17-MgMaSL7 TaxID=1938893 RepID=UPI000D9D2817|nr:hypothetical protein [Nocardiopsis sp. L17-MgMaSL7]PWV55297.1 hypothetical protein BDW27_103301 [Nocardiopsis sp. L17-MgMaSL7]
MRYAGPIPHRVVRPFNQCVLALRSSPRWGRPLRRHLTVVTYTGRRSGREFSTPVAYRLSGSTVTVPVAIPERKKWWRNFTGEGGPLSLELPEGVRSGHAVASTDQRGRVTVTVRLDD